MSHKGAVDERLTLKNNWTNIRRPAGPAAPGVSLFPAITQCISINMCTHAAGTKTCVSAHDELGIRLQRVGILSKPQRVRSTWRLETRAGSARQRVGRAS